MLSTANVLTQVRMVCGHLEDHELRYSSSYQRNQLLAELHSHVCCGCMEKIRTWIQTGVKLQNLTEDQLALKLPPLSGSPKQKDWASQVRMRLLGSIDAFFRDIWKQDDPTALLVWRALCVIAMIPDSGWWIRQNNHQVMPDSLVSQTVSMLLWNPHISLLAGHTDPYSMLRRMSPTLITKIVNISPADVMPSQG